MANKFSHYLRGTKHMEGAWPEGTVTNEYGERVVGDAPTTSFVHDLGMATKGVPSEIAQWWKDAHRWTRPKYIYKIVPTGVNTEALVAFEHPDYTLWKRLGIASDALLMLVVLLIVLMVAL